MAETVDLESVDDALLMKAFWLQRHIHEHGIEGINFRAEAEDVADNGDVIIAQAIRSEL